MQEFLHRPGAASAKSAPGRYRSSAQTVEDKNFSHNRRFMKTRRYRAKLLRLTDTSVFLPRISRPACTNRRTTTACRPSGLQPPKRRTYPTSRRAITAGASQSVVYQRGSPSVCRSRLARSGRILRFSMLAVGPRFPRSRLTTDEAGVYLSFSTRGACRHSLDIKVNHSLQFTIQPEWPLLNHTDW